MRELRRIDIPVLGCGPSVALIERVDGDPMRTAADVSVRLRDWPQDERYACKVECRLLIDALNASLSQEPR